MHWLMGMISVAILGGSIGCGSSVPPPRQAVADVQGAERAATELGAQSVPNAELHLRLAREQANTARRLMNEGENERAADILVRAKADAELAVALTHEARARDAAREAANQANSTTQGGGAR